MFNFYSKPDDVPARCVVTDPVIIQHWLQLATTVLKDPTGQSRLLEQLLNVTLYLNRLLEFMDPPISLIVSTVHIVHRALEKYPALSTTAIKTSAALGALDRLKDDLLSRHPLISSSPSVEDDIDSGSTRSSIVNTNAAQLPPELCLEILDHIICSQLDSQALRKCLLNLSLVSKSWREIVLPHLWLDPRPLDCPLRQFRFGYVALLYPQLASKVHSLNLLWSFGGENVFLMEELCINPSLSASVTQLTLYRCKDTNNRDYIGQKDVSSLSRILSLLPNLRTLQLETFDPPGEQEFEVIQETTSGQIVWQTPLPGSEWTTVLRVPFPFSEVISKLSRLSILSDASWCWAAIRPSLGPRLNSLCLGQEVALDPGEMLDIARRCTNLKELRIYAANMIPQHELAEAFRMFGANLEVLCLGDGRLHGVCYWVEELRHLSSLDDQHRKIKLRHLELGKGQEMGINELEALAYGWPSGPGCSTLEILVIEELDCSVRGGVWDPRMDEALDYLVYRHAPTLKRLAIRSWEVGQRLLERLADCKQLESLDLRPRPSEQSPGLVDATALRLFHRRSYSNG